MRRSNQKNILTPSGVDQVLEHLGRIALPISFGIRR
jgi:hypothetical protein